MEIVDAYMANGHVFTTEKYGITYNSLCYILRKYGVNNVKRKAEHKPPPLPKGESAVKINLNNVELCHKILQYAVEHNINNACRYFNITFHRFILARKRHADTFVPVIKAIDNSTRRPTKSGKYTRVINMIKQGHSEEEIKIMTGYSYIFLQNCYYRVVGKDCPTPTFPSWEERAKYLGDSERIITEFLDTSVVRDYKWYPGVEEVKVFNHREFLGAE